MALTLCRIVWLGWVAVSLDSPLHLYEPWWLRGLKVVGDGYYCRIQAATPGQQA
jgi:hypothetical protein